VSGQDCYRHLCNTEPAVPIFSRDWWLDAACGPDGWGVTSVENGDEIIAAMPYHVKHKYGFTFLTQPPLTKMLGPWLRPSLAKYAKMLGEQKRLLQALIDQLPSFDHFAQKWHYHYTNWLPFYWRGFRQTTRYTYVLPDLADEKQLWDGLQDNIRREIRKAENRFTNGPFRPIISNTHYEFMNNPD